MNFDWFLRGKILPDRVCPGYFIPLNRKFFFLTEKSCLGHFYSPEQTLSGAFLASGTNRKPYLGNQSE